jgi:CRISPR-associated endonuclease Cas2
MYIIAAYDVKAERTPFFKKICQRYLNRVQNSVFEGKIDKAQLVELQHSLKKAVNEGECVRLWIIADKQIFTIRTIGTPPIPEGNIL